MSNEEKVGQQTNIGTRNATNKAAKLLSIITYFQTVRETRILQQKSHNSLD